MLAYHGRITEELFFIGVKLKHNMGIS